MSTKTLNAFAADFAPFSAFSANTASFEGCPTPQASKLPMHRVPSGLAIALAQAQQSAAASPTEPAAVELPSPPPADRISTVFEREEDKHVAAAASRRNTVRVLLKVQVGCPTLESEHTPATALPHPPPACQSQGPCASERKHSASSVQSMHMGGHSLGWLDFAGWQTLHPALCACFCVVD